MADPFEVRMRFTSQLQHLNASTSSAIKAANYALRYSEFSDDLHSCILEQLERNNMNNRANIMYFLPALCETAKAQDNPAYIRMMERDILRIIDLVAPDDGSGAANVKVVRKVLQQLQHKSFLLPQTVSELEEWISGRDSLLAHGGSPGFAVPTNSSIGAGGSGSFVTGSGGGVKEVVTVPLGIQQEAGGNSSGEAGGAGTGVIGGGGVRSTPQSVPRDTHHGYPGISHNPSIRLDKRQIEQRIEEDRERHKRAREGIWAVQQHPQQQQQQQPPLPPQQPQPQSQQPQQQQQQQQQSGNTNLAVDAEFDRLMEDGSDVAEDDYAMAREEMEERRRHLEYDDY